MTQKKTIATDIEKEREKDPLYIRYKKMTKKERQHNEREYAHATHVLESMAQFCAYVILYTDTIYSSDFYKEYFLAKLEIQLKEQGCRKSQMYLKDGCQKIVLAEEIDLCIFQREVKRIEEANKKKRWDLLTEKRKW